MEQKETINKQYVLEVNETQLRIIRDALESYLRTRMGQFTDLAEDIAGVGFNWLNHTDEQFMDYLNRKDNSQKLFEAAFHVAQPNLEKKTERMLIAEDIWQVIRHELWKNMPKEYQGGYYYLCVDASEPMQFSGQPLPKCRLEET